MIATRNTGNIDYLYGPTNKTNRAMIMSAISGEKVNKSAAGWNKFRRAVAQYYGATGGCLAALEANIRDNALAQGEVR